MKYFEMFAGVGGFGIGITRAYDNLPQSEVQDERPDGGLVSGDRGHPLQGNAMCVGFSEIDPHASAVLRYHYPDVKNYGDCKTINWSEVPDFDLLVGGSPCQDFSIAGKRAGLVGARSGLAYEYIRALEEKHPAHFIFENVRGLLSSNRGWDFAAILNQMAQAGYSLQWQVLNAKHFGVPQNRERVFVIGTRLGGASSREVFFEQGAGGKDIQNLEPKGFDGGGPQDQATSIDANYHKGWGGRGKSRGRTMVREIINLEPGAGQANRRYDPKGIAPTVPTAGGGQTHTDDRPIRKVANLYPSGHEAGNIYDPSGISPTIKVNGPRPNKKNICPKVIIYARTNQPQRTPPMPGRELLQRSEQSTATPPIAKTIHRGAFND